MKFCINVFSVLDTGNLLLLRLIVLNPVHPVSQRFTEVALEEKVKDTEERLLRDGVSNKSLQSPGDFAFAVVQKAFKGYSSADLTISATRFVFRLLSLSQMQISY